MQLVVFALYYPISNPIRGELVQRPHPKLAPRQTVRAAARARVGMGRGFQASESGRADAAVPSLGSERARIRSEPNGIGHLAARGAEASDLGHLGRDCRDAESALAEIGCPEIALDTGLERDAGPALNGAPGDDPAADDAADSVSDSDGYDLLGLIAPEAIQVQARAGAGSFIALESAQAGIYRPHDFRAAPWSGLAYELAPADGQGLHAGSRVLTMRGEVPVEELRPSDRILGLRGPRVAAIAWIGRCTNQPAGGNVASVRIRAGALGPDLPSRDIVVGPDQVVFPDGSQPRTARDLMQQGLAEPASGGPLELFQLALKPYAGAEDGDVILVDGIFAASRLRPAE